MEDDDAEEDAPIVDLCGEGDLYPGVSEVVKVNMSAVAPALAEGQQRQLQDLMDEFPEVFKPKSGCTAVIEHEIHVGEAAPVRQRV